MIHKRFRIKNCVQTTTLFLFLISFQIISACSFSGPVLLFDDRQNTYELLIEVFAGPRPELFIHGDTQKITVRKDLKNKHIFRYALSNWKENFTYRYCFYSEKCASDTFSFKTFQDKTFSKLNIIAGSCLKIENNEYAALLDSIIRYRPDLMIWLGDNVYLKDNDVYDADQIRERYRLYRRHPQLHTVLATIPSIAIHDDHDYGPGDSDSSYLLRNVSNKIFRSYWYTSSMEEYSNKNPGLFNYYQLGTFRFILSDNRSFRSKQSELKSQIFGQHQLKQIDSILSNDNHPANILLSGGQILNPAMKYENLSNFPSEYQHVLKILERSVHPTLILSGDRHHGEITAIPKAMEITASPIFGSIFNTDEINTLRTYGPIDEFNMVYLQLDASTITPTALIRFIANQSSPSVLFNFSGKTDEIKK